MKKKGKGCALVIKNNLGIFVPFYLDILFNLFLNTV